VGNRPPLRFRDARHPPKVYETFFRLCTYGNAASPVCIAQKSLTPLRTKRSHRGQVCPR
jgi:hypothetical protein